MKNPYIPIALLFFLFLIGHSRADVFSSTFEEETRIVFIPDFAPRPSFSGVYFVLTEASGKRTTVNKRPIFPHYAPEVDHDLGAFGVPRARLLTEIKNRAGFSGEEWLESYDRKEIVAELQTAGGNLSDFVASSIGDFTAASANGLGLVLPKGKYTAIEVFADYQGKREKVDSAVIDEELERGSPLRTLNCRIDRKSGDAIMMVKGGEKGFFAYASAWKDDTWQQVTHAALFPYHGLKIANGREISKFKVTLVNKCGHPFSSMVVENPLNPPKVIAFGSESVDSFRVAKVQDTFHVSFFSKVAVPGNWVLHAERIGGGYVKIYCFPRPWIMRTFTLKRLSKIRMGGNFRRRSSLEIPAPMQSSFRLMTEVR